MRPLLLLTALCALALTSAPSAQAAPAHDPTVRPAEVVVGLQAGRSLSRSARPTDAAPGDPLAAALESAGASAALPIGGGAYRVRVAPGVDERDLAARLAELPGVAFAEPNRLRRLERTPSDEGVARQWALGPIAAFDAWEITTGGGVTIAVLDTGVSPSHPDLAGRVLAGFDFYNLDPDPRDDDGHGTFVAGVAAAAGENGVGVAGVCWGCSILPVKVLSRRGVGDDATIAAGIRYATDQGARVIVLSLGGPEESRVLREAVLYASERGALLVAASGNGQAEGNLPNYPAAYPEVLAVSATAPDDSLAPFSTTGDFVDIAAPGAGVWSTLWSRSAGDTYGAGDGTSVACPFVAGAAGLLLSLRPELTALQASELLLLGADDRGPPGRDAAFGYGRLNLRRALDAAADPTALQRSRVEGVVSGVAPDQVTVVLSGGATARPDAAGFYRFDGLTPGSYSVVARGPDGESPPRQVWVSGTALSVARADLAIRGAPAGAFAPRPPPTDGAAYFPETGHTLRGAFRAFWQASGGLPIFGFPISEELTEIGEDGQPVTVQYFERHRLELRPENPPPYNVQLSRLGDQVLRDRGVEWYTLPKSGPLPGCRYFVETGQSLCEPFLSAWRSSGLEFDGRPGASAAESLALFGQPISPAIVETLPDGRLLLVQWFERARFEEHGPSGVLLGLLGNELTEARGLR